MYSISSEKHSHLKCGNYLNISVCTVFVNKQIFEINEPLSVYLLNRPFVELSSISRPLQVQCLLGIIFTYNYFSIFIYNIHLFISINREKTSKLRNNSKLVFGWNLPSTALFLLSDANSSPRRLSVNVTINSTFLSFAIVWVILSTASHLTKI